MHFRLPLCAVALATAAITLSTPLPALAQPFPDTRQPTVQLGPRPYFLVNEMSEGQLKQSLQACTNNRAIRSDFSIGHRGAGMQFPEHTRESYEAAARMGAGIIECDVTFTKDKELVCRHSQSDLHTTTNILVTPLATKCTKPFTPATYDPTGKLLTNASAECRTSDITLAEFRTPRGKMDASNPQARTAAEYQGGTASVRTDLYAGPSSGTLMTHKESIELFKRLGVKMTPELKNASVTMPFDGFTQQAYAQKMIDEYKQMGVPGWQVFAQSFDINDVLYWVSHEPEFGPSAVYLDSASTMATVPTAGQLAQLRAAGVRYWAPPIFVLLTTDANGNLVASQAARDAKAAGLRLITWTLERSGILADGNNGFYYQTFDNAIKREGDVMKVLYALDKDVGIDGIFSDWPATVTFYANCMRR